MKNSIDADREKELLMDRFIAFDLETTGLNPARGARIIEIGAVAVNKGEVTDVFSRLINTGTKIPAAATRVNGITNEMIRHAPAAGEVLWEFKAFIGEHAMIAHNARFDVRFLRYEFKRLGIDFQNRSRCTLEASRKKFPRLRSHRLGTVYRRLFGKLPEGTKLHRALDDAKLVMDIWMSLRQDNPTRPHPPGINPFIKEEENNFPRFAKEGVRGSSSAKD